MIRILYLITHQFKLLRCCPHDREKKSISEIIILTGVDRKRLKNKLLEYYQ